VAGWTRWAASTGRLPIPDGPVIRATDRAIELATASDATLRDGKFGTESAEFDNPAVMSQLGLVPGN
jgi:hypothetical protein